MPEPQKAPEHHFRDDAEDQPESGYPEGKVDTKPSAKSKEDRTATQKGSEAEFDSGRVPTRDG